MKNQNQTKTNPLKNVKNWNCGVPLEPENQPTLIGTSHLVSLLLDAWFLPSGAWWIWLFLLVNCVNPSWSITKLGLWWGLWTGHFPSALPPMSFLQSWSSLCPYPGHLAQSLLIPPTISCVAIVIPFWYFNFMFIDLLPMCIVLSSLIFSSCVYWLLLLVVGFFPVKVCTILIRCSNPMQGSCYRKSLKWRVCKNQKNHFQNQTRGSNKFSFQKIKIKMESS